MKICTILGARPQFIKAAALSRVLRTRHAEVLIHTGQHYDYNMSEVFFDQLEIPRPDYNLGVSGGSHGAMTGRMLEAVEAVLMREQPDMALIYGDTNSTLAGALAAVKLHIPVCHVEAGCRGGTLENPEEVNRVLADRVCALLMCATQTDVENLRREGITQGVHFTGDVMYDALLYYGRRMETPEARELTGLDGAPARLPSSFYLLTCHREENSGSDAPLFEVLSAMNSLDAPTIYPVHPRNQARARRLKAAHGFDRVMLIEPVGYLTALWLVKNAQKVVTDSGGLSREAFAYARQCVTLLDFMAWPDLYVDGMNRLCRPVAKDILAALAAPADFSKKANPFGDGQAARVITDIITRWQAPA